MSYQRLNHQHQNTVTSAKKQESNPKSSLREGEGLVNGIHSGVMMVGLLQEEKRKNAFLCELADVLDLQFQSAFTL